MFSVHTTPKEFKHATITVYFGRTCVCRKLSQKNCKSIVTLASVYETIRLQKLSPATPKRKASLFRIHRFEERFQKPPFSRRISVDGTRNWRNKSSVLKFLQRSVDRT